MKRSRDEDGDGDEAMAKCLMLLSRVGTVSATPPDRIFECKTCNRQFLSFQALGGHRASHTKPRLMASDLLHHLHSPPKPKTHQCSICGLVFALGQALGGHMRRHRVAAMNETSSLSTKFIEVVPVMKKSSSKRVLCLDLNLTPYENNLKLGKIMAPILDTFI